ncbi:uncharacterized protein LOC108629877 [Ceratina calcarata]|uniref:XK-related protein n=1 Tax=Ceratina calcarata TaxID=156304 RepID=A0AAJ7JB09_9HYME|nr:uncharacterized protein LOC108629877 [Ceratina calcarata]
MAHCDTMDRVCEKKPTRFLRVPLKSVEQIYLIFLIPSLINCAVYIVHFSADFVVVVQHFRENNPVWGCCTIGFMYSPAIVYFILTVSRPDWWMTDDDKLRKGVFLWFCIQLCHLSGFVFFALYRYATLIVLSIDAILLTGKERTDTLNAAASPAAIELYFFLQAWFQAAPQAIFQTHLLFYESSSSSLSSVTSSHQSAIVKVLSIVMSVTILAIQTASFQRFESQRVNGRTLPWATWLRKHRTQEATHGDVEEKIPLRPAEAAKGKENVTTSITTAITDRTESAALDAEQVVEMSGHDDERAEIPSVSPNRQASVTPPLPPKNVHVLPPPTPLRGITTVLPLPVPDVPAPPRPDNWSTLVAAKSESATETRVSSSTTPESGLIRTAETRSENVNSGGGGGGGGYSSYDGYDLKIPERRYSTKGLEEDDPAGKFLTFLWWFLFILARLLALVLFYQFYSVYSFVVLCVHYGVVSVYLFRHTKFCNVITFFLDLWLGSVYIVSLIEYRVKFKYADKWVLSYYVFVLMQNTLMTLSWYIYADWVGFWYTYAFYVIFGSMILCVLSTAIYCALLKPKKHRIYAEHGKT